MDKKEKITAEELMNEVFDEFNKSDYSLITDKDGNKLRVQIGHIICNDAFKKATSDK